MSYTAKPRCAAESSGLTLAQSVMATGFSPTSPFELPALIAMHKHSKKMVLSLLTLPSAEKLFVDRSKI